MGPEKLQLLLRLQEKDLRIRELELHLSRLERRRAQLEEKIAQRRAALEQQRKELNELRAESRRRNDEVDSLDERIRSYQKQLDEGIISYKEMETLREKIALSRQRIEQLEEEAIALMDEVALRERELEQAEAEFAVWERQVQEEIAQVETESATERAERERLQEERASLAQEIDDYLLEHYERLQRDFGYPDPLARVEDGSCSGCKIRLAENALEKLRRGRELVICENCHRILYWG